jgi:hypothetical protein
MSSADQSVKRENSLLTTAISPVRRHTHVGVPINASMAVYSAAVRRKHFSAKTRSAWLRFLVIDKKVGRNDVHALQMRSTSSLTILNAATRTGMGA